MPTETEHKYLVTNNAWREIQPLKTVQIRQGYLSIEPGKTIRVRTAGNKGYITIKGKAISATRPEYEYEIPVKDANELLTIFCKDPVEKTRYYIEFKNKTWEVDVYEGLNKGLMVAEIELTHETEIYDRPEWLGPDVTHDHRYSNASLSVNPFIAWGATLK